MHIGLVQVVIKPLLKKGINAPIFMALRDKRLKKIQIISLSCHSNKCLQRTNIFQLFSDFIVGLTCPLTTETLKLDVHIQNDEFHEFKNFVIIFRVCFILMSTNLNTSYLSRLPSNSQETVLLQIDLSSR